MDEEVGDEFLRVLVGGTSVEVPVGLPIPHPLNAVRTGPFRATILGNPFLFLKMVRRGHAERIKATNDTIG